ncbi:conserved hypothetical protein [Treponema primitia ZAS-2]|uniref:DUF1638 domain-containing protein n=1 Tax=Treponema primitia (strain ATCC BAA-887 / DSM 12427 / ZAS-2) TaxID=545694 RepID=F5YPP4_TREPZ|nr:DUF1638 domain-containing protein [Treponema primitia]AEF84199.1 conserved hypothetical protein [Treponema primitia ZAS-2]
MGAEKGKRYKLIACEIFRTEVETLVPQCGNHVDVEILPIGLHSIGKEKMSAELQTALDRVDVSRYDAVLLLYGMCSYGTCGLRSPLPMVITKAHDCITLFMGSRSFYKEYFDAHPGTFYATSNIMNSDLSLDRIAVKYDEQVASFKEKYDGEDLEYLLETLSDPLKDYSRIAYVNNGVGNIEDGMKKTAAFAESRSWTFDEVAGNTSLIERLLAGDWDENVFLVVPPGKTPGPSYEEDVLHTV